MTLKIGINGCGRMGRLSWRLIEQQEDLEVVMVNDPAMDPQLLCTLLLQDSQQGPWNVPCEAGEGALEIAGRRVPLLSHQDPGDIPWADEAVDLVLECSGRFRTRTSAAAHLGDSVQRVVVSAPTKEAPQIVMGVNEKGMDPGGASVVSAASCTTNATAPLLRVLHDSFGIERAMITTLHCPTNTQRVVDAAHRDPRRARASQINLIPTSTNSAHAIVTIIPELEGRLESIAVRVPVFNASLIDVTLQLQSHGDCAAVNAALRQAAESAPLQGILGFEERPLVSCDFAGDPRSSVVDALSTRALAGGMVKVMAWYDNEWGYVSRMVELARLVGGSIR